jgi:hypothetical protein
VKCWAVPSLLPFCSGAPVSMLGPSLTEEAHLFLEQTKFLDQAAAWPRGPF